jgi:hypothetical protein
VLVRLSPELGRISRGEAMSAQGPGSHAVGSPSPMKEERINHSMVIFGGQGITSRIRGFKYPKTSCLISGGHTLTPRLAWFSSSGLESAKPTTPNARSGPGIGMRIVGKN